MMEDRRWMGLWCLYTGEREVTTALVAKREAILRWRRRRPDV
jgi:hypothetical protein